MAWPVVSEPVPAVVGIAMCGRSVPGTGRPFPTGALTKSSSSWEGKVAKRLAALAVSITEPPPTETKASQSFSRAKSMAAWKEASVGSTTTSSK